MCTRRVIVVGVSLLYFGGEKLIEYSCELGRALKMSPMVVGLTIVAFGTSAPEMATTLMASERGASAMAFGNVVGSNIANLALVLGLTAMVGPISTHARFLRREMPIVILVGLMLLPVLRVHVIERSVGALFLFLLIPYLWLLLRDERESEAVEAEFAEEFGGEAVLRPKCLLGVVVSSVMLVGGAHTLIDGAVSVAQVYEVSERVIGLTLLALGTSLPELASCLAAARKGEGDIVLGNLVGSNIFNVLAVLGTAAMIHPVEIPENAGVAVDLAVMIGTSVVLLGLIVRDFYLSRLEGGCLVAGYIYYISYLLVK
ncbi:MAG: calcium/sodium antiporter [Deltaproteobacteria bacterium]|nr:calcium/sodium antiporter [Deltaproteobacteria bacterium]